MPLLKLRRNRDRQHGLSADGRRFALGTRTLADLVAPAVLEVARDHVRLDYLYPDVGMDLSHERYGLDHNRCILCTRCVRVCDEIEGAHTWDIMGRGTDARVITDLAQPWGDSDSCTSCGKCVSVCPTGALFEKGKAVSEMVKHRDLLPSLLTMRERQR